jgi:hypothetical protein
MQCERLIKLIKSWYLSVRDETMAPARMVSFMEQHASTCDICLVDPLVIEEITKITELILPESKIPKAVRQATSIDDDIDLEDEDVYDDSGDENDESLNEDEEEDLDDLDPEEDEFFEDEEEDED